MARLRNYLMLLTTRSNRGRSLRGLFIKYLKRRKDKLLMELCLAPRCHAHAFPCTSPLSWKPSAPASATPAYTSVGLLPCILHHLHTPLLFLALPLQQHALNSPNLHYHCCLTLPKASTLHLKTASSHQDNHHRTKSCL